MSDQLISDLDRAIKLRVGIREHIAAKMGCSARTIERWASGQTGRISLAERHRLRRILNGILNTVAIPLLKEIPKKKKSKRPLQ